MVRPCLAVLILLVFPAATAAAEPPPYRVAVLRSSLFVPRNIEDTFTLRVLTVASSGFAELLVEQEIGRGPFRVITPVPEGEYWVLVTSNRHRPYVRRCAAGTREPRLPQRIRPDRHRHVPVTAREAGGEPSPEAPLSAWCAPSELSRLPRLPWLRTELVAGADGVATVPWIAGGHVILRMGGSWKSWGKHRRRDGKLSIRRSPLGLWKSRWPGGSGHWTAYDEQQAVVEIRVAGRWRPMPPPPRRLVGPRSAFEPWDAIRIRAPEYRTWLLLRGDAADASLLDPALEHEDTGAKRGATLEVDVEGRGVGVNDGPSCVPTLGRYTGGWVRHSVLDAEGRDVTAEVERRSLSPGVPPGRYRVRVRRSLGLPVERTVELPAGTDVSVTVSVEGGSGIRLIARDGAGRLAKTVSFRVVDANGESAAVEYTDPTLGEKPAFLHRGRTLRGVPPHGVIHVDPGEWTVHLLREDEVTDSFPVRCWPGVITRLDTRARRATRGTPPARKVRVR